MQENQNTYPEVKESPRFRQGIKRTLIGVCGALLTTGIVLTSILNGGFPVLAAEGHSLFLPQLGNGTEQATEQIVCAVRTDADIEREGSAGRLTVLAEASIATPNLAECYEPSAQEGYTADFSYRAVDKAGSDHFPDSTGKFTPRTGYAIWHTSEGYVGVKLKTVLGDSDPDDNISYVTLPQE